LAEGNRGAVPSKRKETAGEKVEIKNPQPGQTSWEKERVYMI